MRYENFNDARDDKEVFFFRCVCSLLSHSKEDVQYFSAALASSLQSMQRPNEGYEQHLVGEPAKPVFRKYL